MFERELKQCIIPFVEKNYRIDISLAYVFLSNAVDELLKKQ